MRCLFSCSVALTFLWLTPGIGDEPASKTTSAEHCVEQLSSPVFKTRERATYDLWVMGEEIRPILDQQVGHADTEARQRIAFIREMLDLQITPQTPPEIRRWIHEACEGSDKVCRAAVANLVKAEKTEVVFALLDTKRAQKNADIRRRIITAFTYSLRSEKESQQLSDLCVRFYERILAESDEGVRADTLNQFLTINHVRQSLSKKEWIDRLMKLLDEKQPGIIRSHVIRVFSSSSYLVALAKQDRLLDWIEAAAQMSDTRMRASYLSRILYDSNVTTYLAAESRLAKLIDRLSASGRQSLLLKLTEKKELHQRLYDQLGGENLQAIYAEMDDERASHQLLGRLMAMDFWYTDLGGKEAAEKILSKAKTDRQKRAVTMGLLQGWTQLSTTDRKSIDPALKSVLWTMLTSEPDAWKLEPILLCYGLSDLFGEYIQIDTVDLIFDLVADADAESQLAFARAPTRYSLLCKQLSGEQRVLSYMRRIREVSEPAWRSSASSLCRSEQVAKALDGAAGRNGLLELVKNETESFRYTILSAVIDNRSLLPALIKENKYDDIVAAFPGKQLTYQRAQLTGKILSKQEVVDFLVKSNRVKELLAFNNPKLFTDKDKQIVLGVILNSDVTVKAIIEAGYFSDLDDAIASTDERLRKGLFVKLFVRESFVAMMAKDGQIGALLRMLDGRERQMVAIKLADQLDKLDPSREPRLALDFWKLIGDPKNYYDKQLALKLLSSDWFRKQVIAIDRDQNSFGQMLAATPPDVLEYALQSLMSGDFAVKLVKQDQFPFLAMLMGSLPPDNRSRALTRLAQSSSFRQWSTEKESLPKLIAMIESLEDEVIKTGFLESVLCDSIFVTEANKGLVFKHVVSFAIDQTPHGSARMCIRMLNAHPLQEQTLRSPLLPILLERLKRKDDPKTAELMSLMLNHVAPISLVHAGHGRNVVDAALALTDAQTRQAWIAYMLAYAPISDLMTDDEVRSTFDELDSGKPQSSQINNMLASPVVARLIKLGYFDKLESLADSSRQGYPPMKWQFLINSAVVKHYQREDKDASRLMDFLIATEGNGLRFCLQVLPSNTDALEWILQHHGWQAIDTQIKRLRERDQQQARVSVLRSRPTLTHLVEKRDLKPLALLGSDSTAQTNRRTVVMVLCQLPEIAKAIESKEFADQFLNLINTETEKPNRDMLLNSIRGNQALHDRLKEDYPDLFKKQS